MALTFGTGPEAPAPPIDPTVRLSDFHARTEAVVANLNRLDSTMPMLASTAANLESAALAYYELATSHRADSTRFAAMESAHRQRLDAHGPAVRAAMVAGEKPPTLGDLELQDRVIAEDRAALAVAFEMLEAVGQIYVNEARTAAAARAMLLRLQREPARLEAEKVLAEIRQIDDRALAADIDGDALRTQFTQGGLLP